jgi:SAM-dependent methyltransferase
MVDIKAMSSGLFLGDDGIWYSKNKRDISYPEEGSQDFIEIEDSSFWFKHRNKCIISLANNCPPQDKGPIFDIGGGNGYVSRGLSDSGLTVVLVEPGVHGARNAKKRGLEHIICASFEDGGFSRRTIPAIGLFDVLEHIEDDLSFLKSIRLLLASKGKLYITVPAYPFLWSQADVFGGHYRRYTLNTLTERLNQAGFMVEFSTYIFRFLPLPILLFRSIPYRLDLAKKQPTEASRSHDHAAKSKALEKLLDIALSAEISNIQNKLPMNYGASCLLAAMSP